MRTIATIVKWSTCISAFASVFACDYEARAITLAILCLFWQREAKDG